jgi:hypothetical protein
MVERSAVSRVFEQDQLERRVGKREVRVARSPLGGLGAEQTAVEGDGAVDVVDV